MKNRGAELLPKKKTEPGGEGGPPAGPPMAGGAPPAGPPPGGPPGGAPSNGAAEERAKQLIADLPQADEPLTPECVNGFGEALQGTLEKLSNGQVKVPVEPITEPVPALPPNLYIGGKVLSKALEGPLKGKGEPFDMKAAAMSNDALDKAADQVRAIGGSAEPGPPKNRGSELMKRGAPPSEGPTPAM